MPDTLRVDSLYISTIQLGVLHMIQQGITPIYTVSCIINGQAIRPTQEHIAEDHDIGAVKESSADVSWTVPLRIKDIPKRKF